MAFNPERLSLVVEPIGGVGLRWFNYQTDESEDDLIATDYLPDAEKYGLRAYDLIFVSPTSGTEEPYILTVDAIDADGNATLVNSARFGSDTLSYPDKAAVGRIRVPAATDNILVSAYDATVNPSVGRANYRAASDADYTATPALLRVTDAAGRKFVVNEKRLSPDLAGGDPDGVTDATAALNAIFDYIRADLTDNANSYTRYVIDLAGGKYRVTGSINATGITAWNMIIANGQIIGACTGKAVLDLTGSRGYTLDTLAIYGEEDNQPSIGILAARSSTNGACDNNYHFNVSVTGWFSVAADYAYGQETTKREHCRYWNSNIDAYCGVYQCSDYVTATSDFKTILTGSQSYLQNTFDTCDWRLVDFAALYAITAISKGATTTVTCGAGHSLTNGQTVTFWAVGGMSQINMLAGTVSNATATTFDVNINSSGFSNFTSGGYALKQGTKPAIYWDGGRKHRFINCYAVAYAPDCIEIGFAATPARECTFDFHLEGAHSRSGFRFLAGTTSRILYNVDFHADGLHSASSYFSTNASGAGNVKFYGGTTTVMSTGSVAALALFDDPTKYGVYLNPTWIYPVRSAANTSTMIAFDAFMACIDDGATQYGKDASGGIWTNYTPTATDADGADSPVSATINGEWAPVGPNSKLRYVAIQATMTDIGSMTGAIRFTLPSTAVNRARAIKYWLGENLNTGKTIRGRVLPNTNYVYVTTASDTSNNAFPAVNGDLLYITGIYETA